MSSATPTNGGSRTIYRKDYQAPKYWIREVDLTLGLHPETERAKVRSSCHIVPNAARLAGNSDGNLVLDGHKCLTLEKVSVRTPEATTELSADEHYCVFETPTGETKLEIFQAKLQPLPGLQALSPQTSANWPSFWLDIEVSFSPEANKSCSGLYTSKTTGGEMLYCTQMEAEGFRYFTYFLDRPDVMSKYTCRIEAPKATHPVLLCNGNLVGSGDLPEGRHFATYEDPHVKPAYLFAVIAGNLVHVETEYVTRLQAKRKVQLRVYAEHASRHLLDHALQSLVKSFRFDEDMFELEYDLDIFNIVAVRDFNMGAMENKSLNIFNEKLILASAETATDVDFERVENVVAHEYFHNWTGNRVTCQDWFQLTLKEGLTVFRDQLFSMAVGLNGPSKRIDQVVDLRTRQFPEDSGPLAHPVRPDLYEKIDNFYTATVYDKGAEVIRMYWSILGEEGFKKGMKLYFGRHDGQAVTCDDFLRAMADANGADLTLFSKWYSTSGTPVVHVRLERLSDARVRVHFEQAAAGSVSEILHIPLAFGVLSRETGKEVVGTQVFHLKSKTGSVDVAVPTSDVVLSLNRGFCAPVEIRYPYTLEDYSTLAASDTDPFAKWEAFQALARELVDRVYDALSVENGQNKRDANGLDKYPSLTPSLDLFTTAVRAILAAATDAPMVAAQTLDLPEVGTLINARSSKSQVHPILMVRAREALLKAVRGALQAELRAVYDKLLVMESEVKPGDLSQASIGRRRLKNLLLCEYLDDAVLAQTQYQIAKERVNMTERAAAFAALVAADVDKASANMDFYELAGKYPLVMDKWFLVQALHTKNFDRVKELRAHSEFTVENPNRLRALALGLAANTELFYTEAGLTMFADLVADVDAIGNGTVAGRLARKFEVSSRLVPEHSAMVQRQVQRLLASSGGRKISGELLEILSKVAVAAA